MAKRKKIIFCIIILNIILNIVIVFFLKNNKETLIGKPIITEFYINEEMKREVNDLYPKEGKAIINGQEKHIDVNTKYIKMNIIDDYYVLYETKVSDYRKEEYYKKISIVDTTAPRISFKGTEVMYVQKNSVYEEPGFEAIDNYDGDVTEKVKVKGDVDTSKEGSYTISYIVNDQRGNQSSRKRTVIVKEEVENVEKIEDKKWDPEKYDNTVVYMKIQEDQLLIKGYIKEKAKSYKILIEGEEKKSFQMKENGNYYEGKIPLEKLKKGKYTFYIKTKQKQKLKIKLPDLERVVRFKIKDKLITFSYQNDYIDMKIEPFSYLYDIVIDPGHGGFDTGAIVNEKIEKNINLEQSLYEKRRFEDHGYKVKLIREDDNYGKMLGNESWQPIQKRAYTLGYYGVVSRFVYSNHHNSMANDTYMGWEVLVPATLTYEDLLLEHQIIENWNEIYPLSENHIRMYARNYDTGGVYNKINGQIYEFKDYYAVNRIPLSLFGVKAVIFEGSYMSNEKDFNWYYIDQNYKKLSEMKIKTYIEALGGTYKPLE